MCALATGNLEFLDDCSYSVLKKWRQLHCSKLLLFYADDVDVSERVYINPDLAPEAAKLAYEQCQNRPASRQRRDAPPIRTDTSLSKQGDHPRPPTASSSSIHHVRAPINTLHVINSNYPKDYQKSNNLTTENQSAVDIVSGLLSDSENSMYDSSVIIHESQHVREYSSALHCPCLLKLICSSISG